MPSGTVKWFNTTKGYGFIAPEDGGKDVFVHISAVERSGLTGLADNQKVELRTGGGPRRPHDGVGPQDPLTAPSNADHSGSGAFGSPRQAWSQSLL